LGSLTNNWSKNGTEGSLTQKVLGKVKPDAPIKNKIDDAQKKLELQIVKLSTINEKLQQKHDRVFQKIVSAQKENNHAYAKASELGDVIVTLSPCMSVIKGLGVSLGGIMPQANSSMQDLSKMLGDVLSGSTMAQQDQTPLGRQDNADTVAILEEASALIEGQTKENIPEIPSEIPSGSPEEILSERREASI
jgi:division protein CdvB (Snf7/Vps24/ESCRT-III family)